MSDFRIRSLDAPTDADRAAILERLGAFNRAAAGPTGYGPLCIGLYGADGALEGGLWGTTIFGWLGIELLFVPEALRGRGAGAELMRRAEEEARVRGCIGAWLTTFSFQARGFYEKLGYGVFGAIPDQPRGGARYFLAKRWDGGDAPAFTPLTSSTSPA